MVARLGGLAAAPAIIQTNGQNVLTSATQAGFECTDILSGTSTSLGLFVNQTIAASVAVSSYTGVQINNPTLNAGATISALVGFRVPDLTSFATTAYGLELLVSSGSGKFNIHAGGTAPNFFQGNLLSASGLGLYGNAAAAQSTGWGSPVNGAVVNNYNITDAGGSGSNTNKVVAQLVAVLKLVGILAA